jgi:xanthine/uracil permease
MFTAVFLLTRGLPTLVFFRRVLGKVQAQALAILSATGLPLIVVITTIGVDEHRMKPQNAAALVAAGMLSVLIYPILGFRRLRADPEVGLSGAGAGDAGDAGDTAGTVGED